MNSVLNVWRKIVRSQQYLLDGRQHPSRVVLRFERLEVRQLLATDINIAPVNTGISFSGVGFRNNVAAEFSALVNGTTDRNPNHYSAEIDWGDGDGFEAGEVVLKGSPSSKPFQVKGSHTYDDLGDHDVTVRISGGGTTETRQSSSQFVRQMPSGSDGKPPKASQSEGRQVTVSLFSQNSIAAYEGVGFELNVLAGLSGTLNGNPNKILSNYKAFVNWGDSDKWSPAELAPRLGNSSTPILVKGSHIYQVEGHYTVVVYAQGPDGTSVSDDTTSVNVSKMPNFYAGTKPDLQTRSRDASDIDLNLFSRTSLAAFKSTGFVEYVVAGFTGTLNGTKETHVDQFHAQINWGDSGNWTDAKVELNDAGSSITFLVLGSHTYEEVGTYNVVVYLNGSDGTSTASRTTSVRVTKPNSPLLTGSAVSNVVEGEDVPGPLATFDGNSTSTPPSMLIGNVNWDDGSPPEEAPIRLVGGTQYAVDPPPHSYNVPGNYTAVVTVTDNRGNSSQIQNDYRVVGRREDLAIGLTTDRIVPNLARDLHLNFVFGTESVNVPIAIRNVGNVRQQGATTVSIYLVTSPTLNGEKILIKSKKININLAVGAHQSVVITTLIPSNTLQIGTKYFVVAQLTSTEINDSNLANNSDASTHSFEFLGTPASNSSVFTNGTFFSFVRRALKNNPDIPIEVDRSVTSQFIAHFEGAHTEPYIDTEKHPSIGIGINLDSVSGSLKMHLADAVRSYYLNFKHKTLSHNDTVVINMLRSQAHLAKRPIAITTADMYALFAEALPIYIAKTRRVLGEVVYNDLTQHQKVALISMTYNLGSLDDFKNMVSAFKAGKLLQAGFQQVDSIRTGQAAGLKRRTGVEFANFFEGRESLLGKIVR